MNEVYSNARDRVGQAIADYTAAHMNPDGSLGIDLCSSHDIDLMAEKILDALWGTQGASANMPLVHAQFCTGGETGLRGTQAVDVLKVEANDDGSLTVTLNYWPEAPKQDLIHEASTRLLVNWEQKKAEMTAAWLDHFKHNPADVVLHQSVEKGDAHGEMVLVQKFWIEPKPPIVPDFKALAEKRMSEMTEAQQQDALEGWLRANVRWFDKIGSSRYEQAPNAGPKNHIEFLLARIDQLRGVK